MEKIDKAKTQTSLPRMRGCGVFSPEVDVSMFVCTCDPIVSEADWLRLGRPCWTIRYTCRGKGDSDLYAYASTLVPACVQLVCCVTTPSNCRMIEAGAAYEKKETFAPLSFDQVHSYDDGKSRLSKIKGATMRWYFWGYEGTTWTHQTYQRLDGDGTERTPQYGPGDGPAPRPVKPKHKRTTVARPTDAECDAAVDRMIAEGSPDRPATDTTQPAGESPCPTPQGQTSPISSSSESASPERGSP